MSISRYVSQSLEGTKNILFLFYFSHFHWMFMTLILHIIFYVFVTNFTWIVIFSLLQRTDLYWTFSAYATKFICFHKLKPYANWFNGKKFHFPCSVILVLLMRKLLSFLLMKNMYSVSWFSLDPKVSCQKLEHILTSLFSVFDVLYTYICSCYVIFTHYLYFIL